jgi:hypothetical protein
MSAMQAENAALPSQAHFCLGKFVQSAQEDLVVDTLVVGEIAASTLALFPGRKTEGVMRTRFLSSAAATVDILSA